jgi:heat-inducible transcriptional repressor
MSIVEEYVQFGQPVSSKVIIDKYIKDCSSATIRSEMVRLENMSFLEKSHQSSGRIPSIEGFRFYNENLKTSSYDSNEELLSLKKRIRAVLAKRYSSIEETIENSIKIINEVSNLTSVVSKSNENELLKRIDLIPISDTKATVIVVSSSGLINNNLITLTENVSIEDISICIRVLNDRLIETPLHKIKDKLSEVAPVIQNLVQNYEFFLQEFLNKIFDKNLKSTMEVSNSKNLVMQKEFTDREKVVKILDLLEDTNI